MASSFSSSILGEFILFFLETLPSYLNHCCSSLTIAKNFSSFLPTIPFNLNILSPCNSAKDLMMENDEKNQKKLKEFNA